MKKYIKIISLVLIALIFIGTFVFLYQSQPKRYGLRYSPHQNHRFGTNHRGYRKKLSHAMRCPNQAADFRYHIQSTRRPEKR